MADEQPVLDSFVRLHANRLPECSSERVCYLVEHRSAIPLNVPLTPFSRENIVERFDTDSTTVRWLLNQLTTYDPTRESILGLVFRDDHILTHVVRRGGLREDED